GDLAGDDGGGLAQAVAARGAVAQDPVGGGDDRVEVRAPGLDKHQDQHAQAQRGHQRVDQQPQRAIGGQPGSGDARAHYDGDQQAGAGEPGQQPPADSSVHWRGVTATRVSPAGASHVPTTLAAISLRSAGSHSKMASAFARASSAVIAAGLGAKLCCRPSAVTIMTSNLPSSPSGPATQLTLSTLTWLVCSLAPGMAG